MIDFKNKLLIALIIYAVFITKILFPELYDNITGVTVLDLEGCYTKQLFHKNYTAIEMYLRPELYKLAFVRRIREA